MSGEKPYRVVRRLMMQMKLRRGEPTPNTADYIVAGPGFTEHGPFATEREAEAEAARLTAFPEASDIQREYSIAGLREVTERVRNDFMRFLSESGQQVPLHEETGAQRALRAAIEAKMVQWDDAFAAEERALLRLGFRDPALIPNTKRAYDELRLVLPAYAP